MRHETLSKTETARNEALSAGMYATRTSASPLGDAARGECSHVVSSDILDLRKIHDSAVDDWLRRLRMPGLLVNTQHRVEVANQAFGNLFQEQESPVGKPFTAFFSDPETADECAMLLQRTLSGRKPWVLERKLEFRDSLIRAKIHCRVVLVHEKEMILVQIERLNPPRESASVEYYEQLLENVQGGVAEFSLEWPLPRDTDVDKLVQAVLDARLVDGNSDFAKTYHRSSIDWLTGATLAKFLPSSGKDRGLSEQWIRTGFPVQFFKTRHGAARYENTWIGNIRERQLLGLWWVKRKAVRTNVSEEEISVKRCASVAALASNVAGEVNGLISGIGDTISQAKLHVRPEHKPLEPIERGTDSTPRVKESAAELVTGLDDPAAMGPRKSAEDLLNACRTISPADQDVHCQSILHYGIRPVETDPANHLSRIVENLLATALGTMPEGGSVIVGADRVIVGDGNDLSVEPGKYVRISISARAEGIPRSRVRELSDRNVITTSISPSFADSRARVASRGGTIVARCKPGIGGAFHIFLPAAGEETKPFALRVH